MSKSDGQLIKMRFSQDIVTPVPERSNVALGKSYSAINGTLDNRGFSLVDDDIATANYISIASDVLTGVEVDLGEIIPLDEITVWHYYSDGRTYYETKTEVSEDGVNWVTIFDSAIDGTYAETALGKVHTFAQTNVRYIRDWMNGSTANAGDHWVELKAMGYISSFNAEAFTITGEEEKYIGGSLVPKTYTVTEVKRPDGVDPPQDIIALVFNDDNKFNSVVGDLTIEYDSVLGNLQGLGGNVENINIVLTPIDLIPLRNPVTVDYIDVTGNLNSWSFSPIITTEFARTDHNADYIEVTGNLNSWEFKHIDTIIIT